VLWIAACLIGLLTKAAETSFTLAPVNGLVLGAFPFTNANSFIDQIIPLADTHFVGDTLPSRCLQCFTFAVRAGSKCRHSPLTSQRIYLLLQKNWPIHAKISQQPTYIYIKYVKYCPLYNKHERLSLQWNRSQGVCPRLSLDCYLLQMTRWEGWFSCDKLLSKTILDRLSLIYVNLHATKARTFQLCQLYCVYCLITSDFLVNDLTQTSFFRS
jgi:hypothetical protein